MAGRARCSLNDMEWQQEAAIILLTRRGLSTRHGGWGHQTGRQHSSTNSSLSTSRCGSAPSFKTTLDLGPFQLVVQRKREVVFVPKTMNHSHWTSPCQVRKFPRFVQRFWLHEISSRRRSSCQEKGLEGRAYKVLFYRKKGQTILGVSCPKTSQKPATITFESLLGNFTKWSG